MSELERQFIFYESDDGSTKVNIIPSSEEETIWASLQSLVLLFNASKSNISEHISNIYESGELDKNSTVRDFRIVQTEGSRQVTRNITHYNLDMIISLGYRVNSKEATRFRQWATGIIKEFSIKGFALDDERLKQGGQLFGKDYFQELLERIREIRASERLFYQKITDIFAECSVDYDKNSEEANNFYANVQNKLHWAIHGRTAAELVFKRADSSKPNMGLTTWKNSGKGGKIIKSDTSIAKNYLREDELKELNRVVSMYLDYAENQAIRQKTMKMKDWASQLDKFLDFNEYDVLDHLGKISRALAKKKAEEEYEKFRPIQDKAFKSDFDKLVQKTKSKD